MTFFIIGKELPTGQRLLFADDITDAVDSRNLLLRNLLTTSLILIGIILYIGWAFTHRIFRPVQTIVESIEQFSLGNDPKKDAVSVFGAGSDEFVRIARKLEELFARFRKEAHKLEDLSANIAHELKNGLFEVASTLDLALVEKDSHDRIETARNQILHLGELVQSLLLLANKELEVEKIPIPLRALITKSCPAGDPRIQIQCPKSLTWEVAPELFEIVLRNIIGNALKFTPENGVVKIVGTENTLTISDTGIGIREEDLPFIFDRFYKVDIARTNGSGNGLGLALAKHITEQLHGFQLKIESHLGKGTTLQISRIPSGSRNS